MSDEVVYHHAPKSEEPCETTTTDAVEQSDRGLFDLMKKKEENKCEDVAEISSEFEQKVQVSTEPPEEEEKKKPSLLEKLHRSDSSSSSSSEEEEDGEKKKKKKKKKDDVSTCVPIEKYEEAPATEEKKGFMDKIKEKLPGGGGHNNDKSEEHVAVDEHKEEKKGIFEKIKEKIPGYHSKTTTEEQKEKEEECH